MPVITSPVAAIPRSGIRMLMELALRDPHAIRLEVGEPDATTPAHVIAAAARDAAAGHTGYTSSVGSAELRAALARKVTEVNGRPTRPEEVLVTHGAMHGLAMALQTLLAPGEEVLVPDPEFPNWRMAAVAAGAAVGTYPARADRGFVPDVPDDGVRELMEHLAEATVACPSTPGQRAALAALTGPQDHVATARESYRHRRDVAVELLTLRGVPCVRPAGAFYLMVDVRAATRDSEAFALRLLAERHVSVAPGSAFGPGGEGMVRVSLGAGTDGLLEGLGRLADLVQEWSAAGAAGAADARPGAPVAGLSTSA